MYRFRDCLDFIHFIYDISGISDFRFYFTFNYRFYFDLSDLFISDFLDCFNLYFFRFFTLYNFILLRSNIWNSDFKISSTIKRSSRGLLINHLLFTNLWVLKRFVVFSNFTRRNKLGCLVHHCLRRSFELVHYSLLSRTNMERVHCLLISW